jgi:prepilin-type N-terminal cleavage/methylation domain-containing protein
MNSRPQALLAFTLIELLTVITIIAILMGLLFPAMGIVKEQARRAEAKVAVGQIAAAIKQYHTEYGKYPVLDYTAADATPSDVKLGDGTLPGVEDNNDDLFMTLRSKPQGKNGTDNLYNPRRISFFEYKSAGDVNAPKSGFLDAAGTGVVGSLYDPWGRQYNIIIDSNYNEVINLTGIYADFTEVSQDTTDTGARTGVGVFSFGKDSQVGSPKDGVTGKFREGSKLSDDIISWQ